VIGTRLQEGLEPEVTVCSRAWELAQIKTVQDDCNRSFITTATMAQPAAYPHDIPSLASTHPNLADSPGCASSIVHGDALDRSTITEAEVALTTVEVLLSELIQQVLREPKLNYNF